MWTIDELLDYRYHLLTLLHYKFTYVKRVTWYYWYERDLLFEEEQTDTSNCPVSAIKLAEAPMLGVFSAVPVETPTKGVNLPQTVLQLGATTVLQHILAQKPSITSDLYTDILDDSCRSEKFWLFWYELNGILDCFTCKSKDERLHRHNATQYSNKMCIEKYI